MDGRSAAGCLSGSRDSEEIAWVRRTRWTRQPGAALPAEEPADGRDPAQLGGLASLQWLLLNDNALAGAVPAELGRLAGLAGLLPHNNAELAGALPLALSSLSALQMFRTTAPASASPPTRCSARD